MLQYHLKSEWLGLFFVAVQAAAWVQNMSSRRQSERGQNRARAPDSHVDKIGTGGLTKGARRFTSLEWSSLFFCCRKGCFVGGGDVAIWFCRPRTRSFCILTRFCDCVLRKAVSCVESSRLGNWPAAAASLPQHASQGHFIIDSDQQASTARRCNSQAAKTVTEWLRPLREQSWRTYASFQRRHSAAVRDA